MSTENYYYGQGRISVANRDPSTGALGPWRWVGDVSALSFKMAVQKVQHNESYSGAVAETVNFPTKKTATLDMTLNQIDSDNLSLALFGTKQTIPTGTASAENLGTLVAGQVFYLANPGVSALVITDSTGTPKTLVEGTDYTLDDANFGRCTLVDVGTFTMPLKAAYSYTARTAVGMFTARQPSVALRYEGINLAEGNAPVLVDLYKVNTDPLADLALITTGNDVAGMQVSGGVLLDTTKPASGALGQFGSIQMIGATA